MTEIVPATAEMIRALHKELPRTVRAIAAVEDGRVLGIGGLYPQDGYLVLFGAVAPETRAEMCRHKRTLLRVVWAVLGMAIKRRTPVLAMADPDIDGSERLLLHLGFIPQDNASYQWPG